MNIAVLGWGSLIWKPGELHITGKWSKDGPHLPVEFARISSGGRLTLVIHPGVRSQQTCWVPCSDERLCEAKENLANRENTAPKNIGFAVKEGGQFSCQTDPTTRGLIFGWLEARSNLNAAIWTDLKSNWRERRGDKFSVSAAADYLLGLKGKETADAMSYLCNAPAQISTDLRVVMRAKGWVDSPLSREPLKA